VGLTNLGSESETCVGSRVHLVGVFISFEKNFYRLPFTPPLSGSPYRSFTFLTPSMLNLTFPLPVSIVSTVLRNDLLRMSSDEVDLLSILEAEFLLEILTIFGVLF
jgi:hypothetical protein